MDFRRFFCLNRLFAYAFFMVIVSFYTLTFSPSNLPASGVQSNEEAKRYKSLLSTPTLVEFDARKQKLDASTQILLNTSSENRISFCEKSNLSVDTDASGQLIADVFIQLNDPSTLSALLALGVEPRTQVGDIIIARVPLETLPRLAEEGGVRRIELSKKRQATLDASRADIGADMVHQGTQLPQSYTGQGIIVGVIDSGIDFNHADFGDGNGSRIQHLREFLQGGGQIDWNKDDIDNIPGSVTQRDGDGGGGHGTHVTGIAAGGGQVNTDMSGIAPASDIIFVKGIRAPDSNGGFSDADVIAGCQFIFNQADASGQPAVINLSIGGHNGPHDGSSLYEQTLSNLTGPGKLIVAAAGNEGSDLIHAGGNSTANTLNETLVNADSSDQTAAVTMWYDLGVITSVGVFAYDDQFNFLGQTATVAAGGFMNSTPLVVNNDTLGFVAIDAQTVQDPNNGDGNVIFVIDNNDMPTIDISDVFWGIGSQGPTNGRLDMWVIQGGSFHDQVIGFPGETEMPGNNDLSVGEPATAEKVISVGSYVTKNTWIDVDDTALMLNPPPTILSLSSFSSRGPTRDGRMSPDITAPGQLIFSALSSHLTEGVGYNRQFVLQGGGYQGQNGTSMASPHVAGTIALMLQVKNDLTYDEAVQCLAQTARTNQFTGTTPNNNVGPGYLDAHAAVTKTVDLVSSVENQDSTLPESFGLKQNYPNPFNPSTTIEYSLSIDTRAVIKIYNLSGQEIITLVNQEKKSGTYSVSWDGKNTNGQQVASGLYYFHLKTADRNATRKMILLR